MTKTIKTYSRPDYATHPDFGIYDQRSYTRIKQAHRHEYFQVQLNLAGRTQYYIGATVRAFDRGSLGFVLPYRVHRVPHPPGSKFYVISFSQRFLRPELDVDPLDIESMPLERAPEFAPFLFQEFMDFRLEGADLELARKACRKMADENSHRRFFSLEIIRGNLLLLLAGVYKLRRFDS